LKVFRYFGDWFAVFVAVLSFELLAMLSVDSGLPTQIELLRGFGVAAGATGLWQGLSWVRYRAKNVPPDVVNQLPDSMPLEGGNWGHKSSPSDSGQ